MIALRPPASASVIAPVRRQHKTISDHNGCHIRIRRTFWRRLWHVEVYDTVNFNFPIWDSYELTSEAAQEVAEYASTVLVETMRWDD